MKTRYGFVSNSSSSSFVILLPEGFGLTDFRKLFDEKLDDNELEYKDVERVFSELIKFGDILTSEAYHESEIIREALDDFIIATINTGPDDGQMSLADSKKVKHILGINS